MFNMGKFLVVIDGDLVSMVNITAILRNFDRDDRMMIFASYSGAKPAVAKFNGDARCIVDISDSASTEKKAASTCIAIGYVKRKLEGFKVILVSGTTYYSTLAKCLSAGFDCDATVVTAAQAQDLALESTFKKRVFGDLSKEEQKLSIAKAGYRKDISRMKSEEARSLEGSAEGSEGSKGEVKRGMTSCDMTGYGMKCNQVGQRRDNTSTARELIGCLHTINRIEWSGDEKGRFILGDIKRRKHETDMSVLKCELERVITEMYKQEVREVELVHERVECSELEEMIGDAVEYFSKEESKNEEMRNVLIAISEVLFSAKL